jgi:hypothetical protein
MAKEVFALFKDGMESTERMYVFAPLRGTKTDGSLLIVASEFVKRSFAAAPAPTHFLFGS